MIVTNVEDIVIADLKMRVRVLEGVVRSKDLEIVYLKQCNADEKRFLKDFEKFVLSRSSLFPDISGDE